MNAEALHTFHIPVMGLSFTIDSPIKVAAFGISSAVSIMDDDLIEKMSQFYSKMFDFSHPEITIKMPDYRANRITAYLNLTEKIVREKFEKLKTELTESRAALDNYISMLPNQSEIKEHLSKFTDATGLRQFLDANLKPGSIDVNIMTKLDKDNFDKKKQLPLEFNDAHAALRGFANSNLESSVILSAGMNPRLFNYFENFADFFPDANGYLKKKVILKVSDFRSAMIQGNFLAKKGIWVSEYRIESGLNCGGHAFATEGLLMGPILQEFKQRKHELIQSAFDLIAKVWTAKVISFPQMPLPVKITAQGGIGTSSEHELLLKHYQIDSVGWGTPFLLVPEATTVDNQTRELLCKAKAKDLFLSNISPLGVPFNTIKGTTNDFFKQKRINSGKAGSACPKKFLAIHKDADGAGICTASRKFQQEKIIALELENHPNSPTYQNQVKTITEKACLCVGLSNASLLANELPVKGEQQGVIICPGPNLAFFDQQVSLSRMIAHIYGNDNVSSESHRPHVFINELKMYVDYFIRNTDENADTKIGKPEKFRQNLLDGIVYYEDFFATVLQNSETTLVELESEKQRLVLHQY